MKPYMVDYIRGDAMPGKRLKQGGHYTNLSQAKSAARRAIKTEETYSEAVVSDTCMDDRWAIVLYRVKKIEDSIFESEPMMPYPDWISEAGA